MSFILLDGFDEGQQLRLCEQFLQSLPTLFGCTYGDFLVQGDSFLIRMRDDEKMKKARTTNVMWGRYRKGWLRTKLPISFQFHHVQMDGGQAARFLEELQKTIYATRF